MPGRRVLVAIVTAAAWCTALLPACGSSFSEGSQPGGPDGSSADGGVDVVDGSTLDGTLGDAMPSTDGPAPGDGPGVDAPPATYGDITNPSSWQSFGPSIVDGGPQMAYSFWSAAFDGRYVYYAPLDYYGGNYSGLVVRYDTQENFITSTAWSSFDLAALNPGAIGYAGAEFDGRYVYFVPLVRATGPTYNGLVARYDTTAPFSSASSFDLFDTTTLNGSPAGFAGGAFDGKHVYFAPLLSPDNGGDGHIAVRFDSTSSFSTATSWEAFDITTVSGSAAGYEGAVFDGRYVYYVPDGATESGLVARYDSQGSFTSAAGWATFDMTQVNSLLKGLAGGVFDGRYVYFVPNLTGPGMYSGYVGRYDTQAPFDVATSWSSFDLGAVNANALGFRGAVFDGRYVYLFPTTRTTPIVRLDTTSSFTTASSWGTFDMTTLTSEPLFMGGAFDGEYVYLMPASNVTPALRFAAKTPPSMPPSYKGSFF